MIDLPASFFRTMRRRRTVREFSDRRVPREVIDNALRAAGTAPSPRRFLNRILERPEDERAFMIVVAGYPDDGAMVPVVAKKSLKEIVSYRD